MVTLAPVFGRLRTVFGDMADRLDRVWQWTLSSAPVLPRLQRPSLLVMPLLFAGAVGVAVVTLPGEIERIAALEQDGQTGRALALLEARYARGVRDNRTLYQLTRFYEYYGDQPKARAMLERLAEQRPRDAVIQRQLAQLYKATQDEPAYVRTLQKQIVLRYSEPACRELTGILRRNSEFENEQRALKDCRARGYRRPEDLVRLAFLEASDGRLGESAAILRAVDDRRWLRTGRERMLLFSSLLETQRPEEALRRGVRWLKGQPDSDFAIDLVYRFGDIDRNDLAMQMATAVSQPGDPVALTVAEIMIDQQQPMAARAYLAGWLPQNKGMDLDVANRFTSGALDADDPLLALKGAEIYGLAKFEQSQLALIAEQLIVAGHGSEFDRVRAELAPETAIRNPMLAASIDLREGRLEQARTVLLRVRIDELTDRRLLQFTKLVDQVGRTPALAAVLREPRIAAIVTPDAVPRIVTPAQAKSRFLKRAEAARKVREKRRQPRKGPAAATETVQTTPAPTPTPFSFPNQ